LLAALARRNDKIFKFAFGWAEAALIFDGLRGAKELLFHGFVVS
jgi:hypothetical protein